MTTSTQPPDPTNPNRLLLIGALCGAAAVLLLVIAILIGFWLGRTSQPNTQEPAAVPSVAAASTHAEPTFLPPVITDPLAAPVTTDDLDPLLTAPLPTDPALAAEEVDRLSDEQQRLAAQKQTLSQQVTDSNQLIELKAEQIRLLEAELAKTP